MAYVLKVTSAPAAEPVTLTEAKAHLRVDISDDDTLIESLIKAATRECETYQGRAIITQTLRLSIDAFPACSQMVLPRPPLQSVSSVTYRDTSGTVQTWSSSNYQVDTENVLRGRVVLAPGVSWPSIDSTYINPVQVTYVAGWGAASTNVPEATRRGILMMIGHLYERREAASELSLSDVPMGVRWLWDVDGVGRLDL